MCLPQPYKDNPVLLLVSRQETVVPSVDGIDTLEGVMVLGINIVALKNNLVVHVAYLRTV